METRNYQEDLQHIRKMMEKSSRFISLSGMAGVYAGVFALVGVGYVFWVFQENGIASLEGPAQIFHEEVLCRMLGAALLVMISAIGVAVYLTVKKAKRTVYRFGMPVPKICYIILQFLWPQEVCFVWPWCFISCMPCWLPQRWFFMD